MSVIAANCIEYQDKRKLCIAEENGKKYELENKTGITIRKVKVDGCVLLPDGSGRCDYLFNIDATNKPMAYFVELKGSRIEDAIKQIIDTVIFLKDELTLHRLEARIVAGKSAPDITSNPHYKRLLKKTDPAGGEIIIRTNKFYRNII